MCYGAVTPPTNKRADLWLQHKPALDPQPSQERKKIMTLHSSATALEQTPHVSDALRRRAQSVINDRRTDRQWRSIVRYALEINDPWLADIVRRAGAGEKIIDSLDFTLEPQFSEDDSNKERVDAAQQENKS